MVKPDRPAPHAPAANVAAGAVASPEQVPTERAHFRALLVGNPNYFGNLETSAFAPAVSIAGNTTYEEVTCVGFHPQANRLDAVVRIKQSAGYGGGVCTAGTTEYVRFLDAHDRTIRNCGDSWRDTDTVGFCLRAPA